MKIELVADLDDVGGRLYIRAIVDDNPVDLISGTVKEDEDEVAVACRLLDELFNPTDLAEQAALDELREEYLSHEHGRPT